MRTSIIATAVLATAILAPAASQAQGYVGSYTTGVVRGPGVIVDDDDAIGIAVERRPAFREYIVHERVPSYAIPGPVIVGGVLPQAGIVTYDVPRRFGPVPYRYTVVNGETVLVEPRTRRIIQVID